jgi:hypothetical protein
MSLKDDVRKLMAEAEYFIACSDAEVSERLTALDALSDWLSDLRVSVHVGRPMADSDV